MNYKLHTACRVCGSEKLTQYLDLGMMPLSNNLCNEPDDQPERYPLKVLFCEDCSLSQLSIVIDPETLFGHYVYRSSISQGYKDHCREMAIELKEKYNLNENSFHIDIAGNDGALLSEFKKIINSKMLNVDPAENLVQINEDAGIRMYNKFWGKEAAQHLILTHWPKADLLTATNVFAHVDDVKEFLEAAKMVLNTNGVLVLEFPYLVDFIEKGEFDTIYFEHLSYFGVYPVVQLCAELGMCISDVTHHNIHGGSVRLEIRNGVCESKTTGKYVTKELLEYWDITPYLNFAKKVRKTISVFRDNIIRLKAEGKTIAAFGASAKGNTLLNCAGITSKYIDYIIDETPEKIGKYSPGTGIEIAGLDNIDQPDYIVLLAWNFSREIIDKCEAAGFKGKYIFPLTFEVV